MPTADRTRRPRRRAALTLELLFVFPILLVLLLAAVEFSLWLSAQERIDLAAREGARVAATGGGAGDVETAVRNTLGPQRFAVATLRADLTDASGDPLPSGEPVSVTVAVPAGAVVPDLLAYAALSIRGQTIAARVVMRKE